MSLAKRFFELQQVDSSIQAHSGRLNEIRALLSHNDAYEEAKANLAAAEARRKEHEAQYKDLDAEAEELRSSIGQINQKLYGGKIKNPKELVGYEQEATMLKATLAKKDDALIDLMEATEADKAAVHKLKEVRDSCESAWNNEKVQLQVEEAKASEELAALEKKRSGILSELDKETLATYEGIRGRKGQAVARVEQGRCLGCRVTLSVSELQRVRGATIVTCSNCGRILYLG